MSKVLFYAVDPGAVSIMLPVWESAESRGMNIDWAAEGFAADYLNEIGISFEKDLNRVIDMVDKDAAILFGSQTNFSRTINLMDAANKKNIRTFFIFDHWCNYDKHFIDLNRVVMPSAYILAIDNIVSNELRKKGISADKIKVVGHPAIENTIKLYRKFNLSDRKKQILFLSEPLEKDYGFDADNNPALGYNEFTCLDFLLKEILSIGGDILSHDIIVKLHPREDHLKMEKLVAQYRKRLNVSICKRGDPVKLIFESEYILSMRSVLLMHSMAIGKRTASVQINRNELAISHTNSYLENILVEDKSKLKEFVYENNIKRDISLCNDSSDVILGLLNK